MDITNNNKFKRITIGILIDSLDDDFTETLCNGIEDIAIFKECLEELVNSDSQRNTPSYLKLKNDMYFSNEKRPTMKIGIDNLSDIYYNIYIKTETENKKIPSNYIFILL